MNTLRWEQLLRYRFIEIIVLWEGRLTTRHLCEVFGIGRQQASKDINNYIREVGPGNLEYDKFLKGYKPTSQFKPEVTEGCKRGHLCKPGSCPRGEKCCNNGCGHECMKGVYMEVIPKDEL